jgi:hypothetical protein
VRFRGVGFLVTVAVIFYASSPAWADSVAPPAHYDSAEIYLSPGSKADLVAYERCAHVTNPTTQTVTPLAVAPAAWLETRSRSYERGHTVLEIIPCR